MSETRQQLGQFGEQLAASFLQKQGYTILDRNFRCRSGELDIIAKDEEYLVVVEVKTRRNTEYGEPAAAVDFRKQRQICRATWHYLHKYACYDCDIRFDIVAIQVADDNSAAIDHIINAFEYCG